MALLAGGTVARYLTPRASELPEWKSPVAQGLVAMSFNLKLLETPRMKYLADPPLTLLCQAMLCYAAWGKNDCI